MTLRRRDFLTLAAGVCAGLAASPAPWQAADSLTRRSQDPPWLPGIPRQELDRAVSVSLACPSGLGVEVFSHKGKPVYVRGNPEHPLSLGAITPAALAEPCGLHHPARALSPLARNAAGVLEPVSWARALDVLVQRLGAARSVLALGPARQGLLRELLGRFLEPWGPGSLLAAADQALAGREALAAMGTSGQPGYDLDNAPGLVCLGADPFGSMPAAPHFMRSWARQRETFSCLLAAERGTSSTLFGRFLPLPAAAQAHAALGLAWHLLEMNAVDCRAADLGAFADLVRGRFAPEDVARRTGLPPDELRGLAQAVAQGALPMAGSTGGGAAGVLAGLSLSLLTGGLDVPGGVWRVPPLPGQRPGLESRDAAAAFKAVALGLEQAPDALLLVESDPACHLPEAELAARAVSRASFKAAFSPVMTASAALCDLVLPTPMPLERLELVPTPHGLAFACLGLSRPLVRPAGGARHPGDVLAEVAARLGRGFGVSGWRQYLRREVAALEGVAGFAVREVMPWQVLAGAAAPAPEADMWKSLEDGLCWAAVPSATRADLLLGARFLDRALPPQSVDLGRGLALTASRGRIADEAFGPPVPGLEGHASLDLEGGAVRGLKGDAGKALPGGLSGGGMGAAAPEQGADAAGGLPTVRLNSATSRLLRVPDRARVRLVGQAGEFVGVVVLDETVMDGHLAVRLLAEQGASVMRAASWRAEPGSGLAVWDGCRVRLERT